MDNSVYVALSRQVSALRQLNVISNNIANANTAGFKSEALVFQEFLTEDANNEDTAFVQDFATIRNLEAGSLQQTSNTFDLAINGSGYFSVQVGEDQFYTRSGNFTLNQEGVLTTQNGDPVLSGDGNPIQFAETDRDIAFFGDGRIEVAGAPRGDIGIFQFEDEQELEALSGSLFSSEQLPVVDPTAAKLAQGFIEKSNVNPIKQTTDLIQMQRSYEGVSGFISGLYEIQEDAIRRIARQNV